MTKPIRALVCACLLVALLAGVRLSTLLSTLEMEARRASGVLHTASAQLQQTLHSAEAVLLSVRSTTEAVRRSSASQLGYYEAIGRRSSTVLAETALLIRHTDARMERLSRQAEMLLEQSRHAVDTASDSLAATAASTAETLSATTAMANSAQAQLESVNIAPLLNNLTIASEHLSGTAAAAEQAMGHVRDILSPTQKGFWRRLVEAFIPRPAPSLASSRAAREK